MRPAITLLMAGAMFGFASCGSKGKQEGGGEATMRGSLAEMPVAATQRVVNGDTVVVADMQGTDKVYEIKGSDVFDSVELIRLDNADEALVGGGRVWFTGDRFIIFSEGVVKQFDRSGKYLGNIGARGQGPGEYAIAPYSIYVDKDGGAIYMAPYSAKSLMRYDLDGTYVADIPLAFTLEKSNINVDTKARRITAAAMPFESNADCPNVYVQDFDGNVISSVRRQGVNVPDDYSSEVYTSISSNPDDFNYAFFDISGKPDSLYRYADGKLKPVFTSNFNEPGRNHEYTSLPNFYVAVAYGEPEQVSERSFIIPSGTPFLVNRSTLRGGYVKISIDEFGLAPTDFYLPDTQNDYFIKQLEPASYREVLNERLADPEGLSDEQIKKLTELRDSIDDEDNNYLILAHWRND